MQLTRILALMVCFGTGASVPVLSMADTPQVMTIVEASYHTSSRDMAHRAALTVEEQAAARAQLWALTQQGGTQHCNAAGVTAPCADVISFPQEQ